MSIIDGGQAFPSPAIYTPAGDQITYPEMGMTLRDWFASQAMIGLQSSARDGLNYPTKEGSKFSARSAFAIADAMLEEREVKS